MKRTALLLCFLLVADPGVPAVGATGSAAGSAIGSSALALAALVAADSPSLGGNEKAVMARLLAGDANFAFPPNMTILVRADAIVCRASNIDITRRSCELTFGTQQVMVEGREAQGLFATMAEMGIAPEGAAGTIYESLSQLSCTIDPAEIRQKSGGGADCMFEAGAP